MAVCRATKHPATARSSCPSSPPAAPSKPPSIVYPPCLTSPSVTTVGATTNQPDEAAASFSGGGFSNYFAQPSYQSAAVASYLSKLGTNATGLFNASGRAYPDVAAYGTRYDIVSGSAQLIVSGTSCSTPTFAAIIALINDQLLSKGKSVLGFLNPWLYSTVAEQGGLNDIVDGNNLACGGGTTGFYAAEGWDPVRVVVRCGWLMVLMTSRADHRARHAELHPACDIRRCMNNLLCSSSILSHPRRYCASLFCENDGPLSEHFTTVTDMDPVASPYIIHICNHSLSCPLISTLDVHIYLVAIIASGFQD